MAQESISPEALKRNTKRMRLTAPSRARIARHRAAPRARALSGGIRTMEGPAGFTRKITGEDVEPPGRATTRPHPINPIA